MTPHSADRPSAPLLLPTAVAAVLGKLPAYPGSWLLALVLNRALVPHLPADVRQALEHKRLRLRISDAGLVFDVSLERSGFVSLARGNETDLTIGASLHDLWRLSRREEDPDTLFFSRRLVLEGDTELGLLFKNTLDALDFSALDLFLSAIAKPSRFRPASPGSSDRDARPAPR
jgi:predicted lipid carrier protein YhbT